jgi:hypothetical protein
MNEEDHRAAALVHVVHAAFRVVEGVRGEGKGAAVDPGGVEEVVGHGAKVLSSHDPCT